MNSSQVYSELDRRWKATCRILLQGEVGNLADFRPYLAKYAEPIFEKKSDISGQKTIISLPNFCIAARFISNDETGEYAKRLPQAKLSINDTKDIDSAIRALSENFVYSGSIVTGNSLFVEDSNSCVDSTFVLSSSDYYNSKYIAYSTNGRQDEHIFGSSYTGESKFIITSYDTYRLTRCFETLRTFTSYDCYYSANLENCSDCLFSFNQRGKRRLVGNLELPKAEFGAIKAKLVSEIASELGRKKNAQSILEIIRD